MRSLGPGGSIHDGVLLVYDSRGDDEEESSFVFCFRAERKRERRNEVG